MEKTDQVTQVRGNNGEVGQPTAGLTVKQRWHEAHFTLEDTKDGHHPNRQTWKRKHNIPSLKTFARQLSKEDDQVTKDWFANKAGAKNQKRTDANASKAVQSAAASKSARRKMSKKKPETPAA